MVNSIEEEGQYASAKEAMSMFPNFLASKRTILLSYLEFGKCHAFTME